MAIDQQGIMALPEGQQAAVPPLSYGDSYDAMRQALQQVSPEVDAELQQTLTGLRAIVSDVSDEELQQLIDAVQTLIDDPEGYAKNIAQAVREGDLEKDAFPEEYDEEFLGAVLTILLDEQRSRDAGIGMMMPPPQQFARGGIAEAARLVASKGRNGDTMLAHITPSEARLLRSRGGSGTINPETGLPEYFLKGLFKGIGKVFSAIGSAVKSALKSPIGRIIGTIALSTVLGPAGFGFVSSAAAAAGISSGVVAGLAGGDLKDILISAGTGYFGAAGGPVSEFIGSKVANPLIRDALVGAGVGTAAGLLQGQNLKNAVKGGLTAGAISGGMSYLQNRGNLQLAKADAEDAAAANANQAVTDNTGGITNTASVPTSTPGLFKRITTYADGRIVEQMVDGRGAPIGAPIPMGSAAPTPAPLPSAAPTPSAVSSDYLQGLKASQIKDNFGVPTQTTATNVPSKYDLVPPPSGITVDKYVGGLRPNLANAAPASDITGAPSALPKASYQVETPSQYTVPEVGKSLSTMGRGIKEMGSGKFSEGSDTFLKGAEDLFFPGPSDKEIRDFAKARGITPAKAAQEIGSPGVMRTYGPGVVALTGIGAAAGMFDRNEPPESEFAKNMRRRIDLSDNPRAYYVQDIPGVLYDERGMIIGRKDKEPPLSMADISVPAYNYSGYTPRYAEGGAVSGIPDPHKYGISGPDARATMPGEYGTEGEQKAPVLSEYEKNASKYIVQDLPGVKYSETGTITAASAPSSSTAKRLTLESVRAPSKSYSGYQSRFAPPPTPPSIRDRTSDLFQQYVGTAPTSEQLDYWGGIFELDNEITPDEITRLQNAANVGKPPALMNMGGIAGLKQGGYPRRTGQISGPGTETSDSIPAMLSDGEFVMTARAVRGMGKGSRREGARKMYALMHQLERNAARG